MFGANRLGAACLALLLGACSARDATLTGSMQGGAPATSSAGQAGAGSAAGGGSGAGGAVSVAGGAASCNPAGGSLPMSYGGRAQLQSEPLEPQDCSSPPQNLFDPADQCACEGLTCPPEESCLSVFQPPRSAVGGPGSDFNGCFALCESDDDCSAPQVCVRNLYGLDVCAPACRNSADCVAETCGVCQPGSYSGHGVDYDDPSSSSCWYPGPCDATSCEGCMEGGAGWHLCSVQAP